MFRFKMTGEFDLNVMLGIAALVVAVVGVVLVLVLK